MSAVNLHDIIHREPVPAPWAEGEKIPWDDPEFSERMLAEHLTDAHDAASRRAEKIDRHVDWINTHVMQNKRSSILDLGCGPGLYMQRLARLGHQCVGIDFSPASIDYARSINPDCQFIEGDLREVEFCSGYGLIMMIFGELNAFRPGDAKLILQKCREALADGGVLLLEAHSFESLQRSGQQPPTWRSYESGLFSSDPHLLLREPFWDDSQRVATTRFYVVATDSGSVDRYAESIQAYSDHEYRQLFESSGFTVTGVYPSLDGLEEAGELPVYLARPE
jgi:SAM-dependent methyltransferase